MNYGKYRVLDQCMVRVPYKSVGPLNLSEEAVISFCHEPIFQEQILIASLNLYKTMICYLESPEQLSPKQKRDFFTSVRKYMVRSTTRTTPFGLFSAVGTGRFQETDHLTVHTKGAQKTVHVDTEWIFRLVRRVEKDCIAQLHFATNTACVTKGNRAFLLYTTDGKAEEISIRATPLFYIIYNGCKDYMHYSEIFNLISASYPDVAETQISGYISQLVEKEYLISDIRPPISNTPDPLDYMYRKLQKSDVTRQLLCQIERVQWLIAKYTDSPIGIGIETYQKILQTMEGLVDNPTYLQVDLHLSDGNIAFGTEYAQQIEKMVAMLVALCRKEVSHTTYLDSYRVKFLERYGYEREVPILELLDPIKGIGAPASYQQPANDYTDPSPQQTGGMEKICAFFLSKYSTALMAHGDITFTEEEVRQYLPVDSSYFEPESFELYLFPKSVNNTLHWYVSPLVGADKAGKTFGRFADTGNQFGDVIRTIDQQRQSRQDDLYETCSFNYLPNSMRSGNVTREISHAQKEMTLYTSPSMPDRQLDLANIVVGIDSQDRFYMVDLASDKYVITSVHNMFNPMLQPNVIRLMQDISDDHTISWGYFPWTEAYQHFDYVPRVSCENFVLSGAKWRLTADILKLHPRADYSEFIDNFSIFRDQCSLPDHLYIKFEDNRLQINIRDSYDLEVLYNEFKKSKTGFIMLEEVESGDNIVFDENGNPYNCEIVVPIINEGYRHPEHKRIAPYADVASASRTIVPFDGWLYLNLYTTLSREEEVVAFAIPDFFESLGNKGDLKYFFIRYRDPVPHIRLRISADPAVLQYISSNIFAWVSDMLDDQLISRFSILPYEREIERYGGRSLIEHVETLFSVDSVIIASFMRMARMNAVKYTLEELCVISLLHIIGNWLCDFGEALGFLTQGYESSEYKAFFKKDKPHYLEICDIENDWASLKTSDNSSVYQLMQLYSGPIQTIRALVEKANDTTNSPSGILSSILHMHCNRMLGTTRALENKAMAYCEKIMYAKKYQMRQKRMGA